METVNPDGEIVNVEVFFKTPYNHNTNKESNRTATSLFDESKTQQHMKDETDINIIVDRFLKTGQMPNITVPPTYENFGEIFDFQSALDTLKAATDSFMALPAKIRAQFQNNPANYVAYVDAALEAGDTKQLEEWGMVVKKAAPATPEPPKEPGTPKDPPDPKTQDKAPQGPKT